MNAAYGPMQVSHSQQALFCLISLVVIVFVLSLVLKKKLELRYALPWLSYFGLIFIFALIPQIFTEITYLLGFQLASNAIFSLGLLSLLLISFYLSLSLAKAKKDLRQLTQELALLQAKLTDKT